MRKLIALAFLLTVLPMALPAQEITFPKVEVFTGFSYLRMEKVDYLGWNGSIDANLNKNLGIVMDVSGFYNSKTEPAGAIAAHTDASIHSVLVGPRVSDPRGRWNPFAQALMGWGRVNQKVTSSGGTGTAFSQSLADNVFSLVAGGGMDYHLSDGTAIRLIQIEYAMLNSGSNSTHVKPQGFRIGGGMVFTFGRRSQ
jgi:opacity protein-like surface antigen